MYKLVVPLIILSLAACSEPTRDVEYYEKNEAALDAQIEKCNNNPGELEHTPNCVNARQAAGNKFWGN